MAGRRLDRVKAFSQEQCSRLKAHNILSCKDVLVAGSLELMSVLQLSFLDLHPLTQAVSEVIAPTPTTALSLHRAREQSGLRAFLPTSLPKLDSALHGGLPAGTLTELAGPPGCGKTQFCITLSVVTALPLSVGGRGVGVVYIDTEAAFSAERLVEVAKTRYPTHFSQPARLTELAGRVRVHQDLTSSALSKRLQVLEEELAEMQGPGLVVMDSIASPIRREFDTRSGRAAGERAAVLSRHAARLKYLAEAFNIPVVVTNQITTQMSHDIDREADWSESGGGQVTAALGNTWAHCVNTRLLLGHLAPTRRLLTVAKSPLCGCDRFVLSIEERGVVLDWMATVELGELPLGAAMPLQVRSAVDSGMAGDLHGAEP